MSRQTRKRRIHLSVRIPRAAPSAPDCANTLARFGSLRSRAGVIGFPPMGPRVDASTPKELREATDRALVQAAEEQEPC